MDPEQRRAFLLEGTRTAKCATTRRDGRPHVVPVWFLLDGDAMVFITARNSVKGRAIRRDGRVAMCVDLEQQPYAFVMQEGTATATEDDPDLLEWSIALAHRYGRRAGAALRGIQRRPWDAARARFGRARGVRGQRHRDRLVEAGRWIGAVIRWLLSSNRPAVVGNHNARSHPPAAGPAAPHSATSAPPTAPVARQPAQA
jgi:PPOX class probable F420-dependent enzyme